MNTRASTRLWMASLVTGSVLVNAGCENKQQRELQKIQAGKSVSNERRDSINEAFQHLPQLIRLDRTTALKEIKTELNSWSKGLTNPPDWKSPGLLETIPPSMQSMEFASRASELVFDEEECEYLLQCQILTEICHWVLAKPYNDPLFQGWLADQQKTLSPDEARNLETTLKLFDWTVCNVSMVGAPSDAENLQVNPDMPLADNGAVYRQLPWQTIMFARGERWQRARVFTQLLFSQGIDCVVLALPGESGAKENSALRLWCVAVPVGDEFYLFEPQWGLPILSQNGNGIATLREAKADPNVLRRASVPGAFQYPVKQEDLKNLIALVDCDPFAVSRTMKTLEQSLTGDNRFRLSLDADRLEQKIQKLDPELSVRLWNVPWLAHAYNTSVRERLTERSPFSGAYLEQFGVYIMDTPISRARMLHFKGDFETNIEAPGALRTYMDFRVDEQTLRQLLDERAVQEELGVVRRPFEKLEDFQFRLQQAQGFFRKAKFDIGIFLAMANMDLGKPDTAIDWLQKRTLDIAGTERWHSQAHYLLARMHELKGDYKAAADEYRYENSPQAAGNRIRLRKLRQLHPDDAAE